MITLFLMASSAVLNISTDPNMARNARPAATAGSPEINEGAQRIRRTEQRYCVVGTITGSRIEHKECHTRAEWLDQGFDPLAKK